MEYSHPREFRPLMRYVWPCIWQHKHAYRWGDYIVLPFGRADTCAIYMATVGMTEVLAVVFEFYSEESVVALPCFANPMFSFLSRELPGLKPGHCAYILQLHRIDLANQFMVFADEVVADVDYGRHTDYAALLQESLDKWCRLFCGGGEPVRIRKPETGFLF